MQIKDHKVVSYQMFLDDCAPYGNMYVYIVYNIFEDDYIIMYKTENKFIPNVSGCLQMFVRFLETYSNSLSYTCILYMYHMKNPLGILILNVIN